MASIQEVQWPEVYQLVLLMAGQFTSWSQDEKRLRTTAGLELVAQTHLSQDLVLTGNRQGWHQSLGPPDQASTNRR
jgi:hypothetical protein